MAARPSPYANQRWRKARATFLSRNPTCRFCRARGIVTAATVVDHIRPHKGDQKLFWDTSNWQALCQSCHSTTKQAMDRTGIKIGCDVNGMPIDPKHPWNSR